MQGIEHPNWETNQREGINGGKDIEAIHKPKQPDMGARDTGHRQKWLSSQVYGHLDYKIQRKSRGWTLNIWYKYLIKLRIQLYYNKEKIAFYIPRSLGPVMSLSERRQVWRTAMPTIPETVGGRASGHRDISGGSPSKASDGIAWGVVSRRASQWHHSQHSPGKNGGRADGWQASGDKGKHLKRRHVSGFKCERSQWWTLGAQKKRGNKWSMKCPQSRATAGQGTTHNEKSKY